MKRSLLITIAACLAAPALAQERAPFPPGSTISEKLTQGRKDGDAAERKTRERTFTSGQSTPAQMPTIIINNNNTNTNTNPVNVNTAIQNAQAVSPAVPAVPPVRPGCTLGVVMNLGFDAYARPIFANVRTGPGVQFGNVPGPDLSPVLLPDGVRVGVCGRQGRWLSVEIATPVAPIQGWVFERYVGAL